MKNMMRRSNYSGVSPIQLLMGTQARSMAVSRASRKQPGAEELAQATLMCEFASHGNIAGLKEAQKKGVSLDVADYDFRTPLHLAAAVGDVDTVKWLVENGASMQVDRFGGLAVHDALRNNHTAVAELL
jgi:glutaminase